MRKQIKKRFPIALLPTFLFFFMLLIFGPAEIFFSNVTEFKFVYGEFGGFLALAAVGVTVVITAILLILPEKLYRFGATLMLGLSVASYVQVMFINKQLDLLGQNPDGYRVATSTMVLNLIPWILILGGGIALAFWREKIWEKVTCYVSVFLLCIQTVALVSLFFTASEDAYEYPESQWHLTGEKQYTVSAKENVIVLVLDYFSNLYYDEALREYPGMYDFLHDFTYYSNTDCNYYGTYPSLPHMLSGKYVDTSIPVQQWFDETWGDEESLSFYEMLKEKGYVSNLYTPNVMVMSGTHDAEMLRPCFDNISNEPLEVDVFYKLLFKTMTKMSAYRMAPEVLKTLFYTQGTEYEKIIAYKIDVIEHENFDFYQKLLDQGLQVDEESNYFIVQHLMGPHEWTTGEDGFFKENASRQETVKGCMVLTEEYLNQLKELGVYDDATIVITADHGDMRDSQVVMFVKEPGEQHEQMKVSGAPISLHELRPTLAKLVGEDPTKYGETFYDFAEDEPRERTVWVRWTDLNYPVVQNYAVDRIGYANVYYGFTYTGDIHDLLEIAGAVNPSVIEPVIESFY